jgi:hypothetical protein
MFGEPVLQQGVQGQEQGRGKVAIYPVRTASRTGPGRRSQQLACDVARARLDTQLGHFATLTEP